MEELKKLDIAMKNTYLKLMLYDKDSAMYNKLIDELARQYDSYKELFDTLDSSKKNYYADFNDIEYLLEEAGYLKKTNKKSVH